MSGHRAYKTASAININLISMMITNKKRSEETGCITSLMLDITLKYSRIIVIFT